MRKSIIITVLSLLAHWPMSANQVVADTLQGALTIPDEIISRIPEGDLAQFLIARQKVINQKGSIPSDAYDEIGVSKEILKRVPSGDLFLFLSERGYVEPSIYQQMAESGHSGPPSPQEMLKLLYLLICLVGGLLLISMVLSHLSRKKDQEIIIKALEHHKDIPIDLLHSSHQRRYLNLAVLLSAIGLGMMVLGTTGFMPGIIAVLPLSMAAGYFVIRYLNVRPA